MMYLYNAIPGTPESFPGWYVGRIKLERLSNLESVKQYRNFPYLSIRLQTTEVASRHN
jgi:hypothetical protein